MSGYALSPEPGTIRLEHVLSSPVEQVWAYLTQDDKRGSWLARGIMELERGGLVALTWRHEELSPHEEVPRRYQAESGHYQEGHVTRLEAPRLLGFSWGQDGEVVFALAPEGNGTRLTLTHRRIEGRPEMVRLASSWHVHLQLLDDVLAGRERRPFWRNVQLASVEHEQLLGTPPLTIRLVRRFEATPEQVFDAWLDPANAPLWMFAHQSGEMVRAQVDPRVNGHFTFTDRIDGVEIEHAGTYVEIERPERLVFHFGIPTFSPELDGVQIDIVETDGGCVLYLTHDMKPIWAEFFDRAEAGWVRILGRMAASLDA